MEIEGIEIVKELVVLLAIPTKDRRVLVDGKGFRGLDEGF
jgi:hypothetical protein